MTALVTAFLAIVLAADAAAPEARVGADVVWKPPADFRATVEKACTDRGGAFAECFLEEMRRSGAPEAAIAFTRRLGDPAYAVAFRDTGRVDVVAVESPFRANENALVYLVNGEPPALDIDDLSRLNLASFSNFPAWAGLKKTYPNLAFFPADRGPDHPPRLVKLRTGGQRFVVVYMLHDGCHACTVVGYARVGWDFDAEGRFLGTETIQVRPHYQ
jgi:hypothetical protein